MTPEEAIQVADEVLLAHVGNPLTDIQRLILRESLAGKGYERMEGYYSPHHIKNEGKQLWDLLSKALGEKVSKTSFRGLLEKRWKLGELIPKPPLLSSYDPKTWVKRKAIIDECLPKLQGHARVLWITGISGIGKTALGECLASEAWDNDPSFQWLYLEILEGQSREFVSVAADLLAKLGDRDLDPQERNNPEQLAKRLLQKMQSHPYWIQIDSLERLLQPEQPTEFVDAYWKTFLERCLTEASLASRLVLTAQAFPTVLVEFSDRYPNVWAETQLHGLSDVDQQIEFFEKRKLVVNGGLVVETPKRDILIFTRIAQIYEGHPLVLKVITEDIFKEFAGNINHYWQVNQREFEQVARELQDARFDETEYNEALDRKVRNRIQKSLEQLPADALDLLRRSSVFRRPVPKKFWLAMIGDRAPSAQKVAYRVLGDRALIEKEGTDIRQHNLIRSVVYDLLKADIPTWHAAERQAAHLWLIAYEPDANAPNLETVRGYLEAFNHYCEVEDWETASDLPYTQLATGKALDLQMLVWGYFRELILIHNKVLWTARKTLNSQVKGKALRSLGNAYYSLGQYDQALDIFEQNLSIMREIDDLPGEGGVLNHLGNVHFRLCRYELSSNYYEQALTIVRQIGNWIGEGHILGNIGNLHYGLGEFNQAIHFFAQYLTRARDFSDHQGECTALGNLGLTYVQLGEYEKAVELLHQSLSISENIKYRIGQGNALNNLGIAYYRLEQYEHAIDFHLRSLSIKEEIGDRLGKVNSLGNLGLAYACLKEHEQAIGFYKQSLSIAGKIGNRSSEGSCLANIGASQLKLKRLPESLTCSLKALDIFNDIGDKGGKAQALKNLAEVHQSLGEVEVARQYCQQALALATELGIPLKEECKALQLKIENEKLEMGEEESNSRED